MNERKIRLADEMSDVIRRTGNEIIHTDNFMPFGDEAITEMTSEKSGSAGNESSRHRNIKLIAI
jgi:hypothetical protein